MEGRGMGCGTWGIQDGHDRTFRKESREFEGGGVGVDKHGKKRSWFWMGKDKR